jgi:hypothetical protein
VRRPALAWAIGVAACGAACAQADGVVVVAVLAGLGAGAVYAGFAWVVCAIVARA